jgi:hypothetical protein
MESICFAVVVSVAIIVNEYVTVTELSAYTTL